MGLAGIATWVQEQAGYLLAIAVLGVILICAFKRAWVLMAGAILALAIVGIFVANPDSILKISTFIAEKTQLNGSK